MNRLYPVRGWQLVIVILTLGCTALHGTQYTVNSASGLTAKLASAQPGDVFVWKNGTYSNPGAISFHRVNTTDNPTLSPPLKGTAAAPITLRAETPGGVVFTGPGVSQLALAGEYLVVDGFRFENSTATPSAVMQFRESGGGKPYRLAHHCRVTNCTVVNFNTVDLAGDAAGSSRYVSIYGTDNRLDHCSFSDKRVKAPLLEVFYDYLVVGTSTNHQIDHNYFGNRPALDGVTNELETMRLGTSTSTQFTDDTLSATQATPGLDTIANNVVERNYFYHCSGEAEVISSKSSNNTYRYNTLVECGGSICLRSANNCVVEGNVFLGHGLAGTGGIRTTGSGHRITNNYLEAVMGTGGLAALSIMSGEVSSSPTGYNRTRNCLFAFNTLVGCAQSIRLGEDFDRSGVTQPPESCRVWNNLISTTAGPVVSVDRAPPAATPFTYGGDIFQGTSLGITKPNGVTVADPKLVEDAASIYRPGPASPALNSADPGYTATDAPVTLDMDGHSRGNPADAGADEVFAYGFPLAPLAPTAVGPGWLNPVNLKIDAIGIHGGSIVLAVRYAGGMTGVFNVQKSTNLVDWTSAAATIVGPDSNGSYSVTIPSDAAPRRFFRAVTE